MFSTIELLHEMVTHLAQSEAVVAGIVMTMPARHMGQLVCDLSQVSMQGM